MTAYLICSSFLAFSVAALWASSSAASLMISCLASSAAALALAS